MRNDGSYDEAKDVVRTLMVEWNDGVGDYQYIMTTLNEYKNGERQRTSTAIGDKAWAKRIAEHYKLVVPKVEK